MAAAVDAKLTDGVEVYRSLTVTGLVNICGEKYLTL